MMENKQCQICNTSSADDEMRIILSKKVLKTSLVKVVSMPCCHSCKDFISRQNKRVRKVRCAIFFISLFILVGVALVSYKTGNTDMLILWLIFSVLGACALTEFVYSLFLYAKYEKIERQECEAAGMQYIGDYPEVQKYRWQGYRIMNYK
ncbi:MAG: hypothetical protein MJZ20_00395 [Bacteroidaceae bacterium]|nr:hypothetical protein [Bacteroidaceae bacterium]